MGNVLPFFKGFYSRRDYNSQNETSERIKEFTFIALDAVIQRTTQLLMSQGDERSAMRHMHCNTKSWDALHLTWASVLPRSDEHLNARLIMLTYINKSMYPYKLNFREYINVENTKQGKTVKRLFAATRYEGKGQIILGNPGLSSQ